METETEHQCCWSAGFAAALWSVIGHFQVRSACCALGTGAETETSHGVERECAHLHNMSCSFPLKRAQCFCLSHFPMENILFATLFAKMSI